MRTLPIEATDDAIRELVAEWSELLALKRFDEALAMFPFTNEEMEWTPELLEAMVAGYGALEPFPDGRRFEVTSLANRQDRDDIVHRRIDVDRVNLFGLDPREYLGMVHYDDVPLNGERSDLTARFHIRRVGSDRLTLEFLDIHVM